MLAAIAHAVAHIVAQAAHLVALLPAELLPPFN